MRLLHYTKDPVFILDRQRVAQASVDMKPKGLWVSADGEYGWKQWCEEEGFRKENLAHEWEIVLKPDVECWVWRPVINTRKINGAVLSPKDWREHTNGGILHLDTELSIDLFHKVYGEEDRSFGVRWSRLQDHVDGIVISPYQWGKRMDRDKLWYYTWDCASGCIWNPEIIESVRYLGPSDMKSDEAEHGRKIVLTGDGF